MTRQYRGQGMTARLISAAVEHARARGATVVEAYPVDSDSPSYRFMGFVASFKKAGFVEAGRAGTRRHVMRLQLDRPCDIAHRGFGLRGKPGAFSQSPKHRAGD